MEEEKLIYSNVLKITDLFKFNLALIILFLLLSVPYFIFAREANNYPFAYFILAIFIFVAFINTFILYRANRIKTIYFTNNMFAISYNFSKKINKIQIEDIMEITKLKLPIVFFSRLRLVYGIKYFLSFKLKDKKIKIPIASEEPNIIDFLKEKSKINEKYMPFFSKARLY